MNLIKSPVILLILLVASYTYGQSQTQKYFPGDFYKIRIEANAVTRFYEVFLNENKVVTSLLFAPVSQFQRIMFRTGEVRRFPNADTPTDQDFDVPQTRKPVPEAVFYIKSLKTFTLNNN